MARIGGISTLWVAGAQLPVRGTVTIGSSRFEKAMVAGLDYVHGYTEVPVVPYLEADVSFPAELNVEDLDSITDEPVVAQLANGWNFALQEGVMAARREINAREGTFRVRFEGTDMRPYRSG